jgi:hypothetical protein
MPPTEGRSDAHRVVGLSSDSTDRAMEAHGVALSKRLCRKPMAPALWRLEEMTGHWDRMVLRAHILQGGERRRYMENRRAAVGDPMDLIREYAAGLGFGKRAAAAARHRDVHGAIGALGGIPSPRFEMVLENPVLKRTLSPGYDAKVLPLVV